MPVTVKPLPRVPERFNFLGQRPLKDIPRGLLLGNLGTKQGEFKSILECTFSNDSDSDVYPSRNGFVQGAIHAYSYHHHLEIRPEDVWFSILTQLSRYINKNAEELREQFVAHEGQKQLVIIEEASFHTFISDMGQLIQQNIRDPELREWIMPAFSTTTETDKVVAAAIMMATMQRYFTYEFDPTSCGLPSVTLLGEKSDWELMKRKLGKLATFGQQPTQWMALLKPVLARMVRSFDDPTGVETLFFWNRIAHLTSGGSGPDFYSGWITAFCFWDDEGNCLYRTGNAEDSKTKAEKTAASKWDGWDTYLSLDNVLYSWVDLCNVPSGYSTVPVDIRPEAVGEPFPAVLLAGSMGIQCSQRILKKDLAHLSPPDKASRPVKASPNPSRPPLMSKNISSTLMRLCCQDDSSEPSEPLSPPRPRNQPGTKKAPVPSSHVGEETKTTSPTPAGTSLTFKQRRSSVSLPGEWEESTVQGTQSVFSEPTLKGNEDEVAVGKKVVDAKEGVDTISAVTGWVLYEKKSG